MSNTIKETSNIMIVGRKRSGKTVEGLKVAKMKAEHLGVPVYSYMAPNTDHFKEIFGDAYIGNITDVLTLKRLSHCVVLIDEAHKHFSTMERKVNNDLRDVLGLSTQMGVSLIMITHAFNFLNESLMTAYFDVVLLKELNADHWDTDRRYARMRYSSVKVRGKDELFIHIVNTGEKIYVKSRLPEWWDDKYSFSYANPQRSIYDDLF